jgi:phosphoglycolate phosphatase
MGGVCSELVGRPVTELAGTSGRTDPQILLDALLRAGVGKAEARLLLPRALHMEVGRLAAKQAELRTKGHMLRGADAALAALSRTPGVVQSVLTGNVKPNAILKLATSGSTDTSTSRSAPTDPTMATGPTSSGSPGSGPAAS